MGPRREHVLVLHAGLLPPLAEVDVLTADRARGAAVAGDGAQLRQLLRGQLRRPSNITVWKLRLGSVLIALNASRLASVPSSRYLAVAGPNERARRSRAAQHGLRIRRGSWPRRAPRPPSPSLAPSTAPSPPAPGVPARRAYGRETKMRSSRRARSTGRAASTCCATATWATPIAIAVRRTITFSRRPYSTASAAIQPSLPPRWKKSPKSREATQPIKSRTGGSTFKNPPGHKAWQLIDAAGCRGLRIGGAQVSEMHSNFLINLGNANAADIETLGRDRAQTREGEFRRRARMGNQADRRGEVAPRAC